MRGSRQWPVAVVVMVLLAAVIGILIPTVIFPPEITPIQGTITLRTPTPTPSPVVVTEKAIPGDQSLSPTPSMTPTPEPSPTPQPIPTLQSTPTPTRPAPPAITPTATSIFTPTATPSLTSTPTAPAVSATVSTPLSAPPPSEPAADVAVNLDNPSQLWAAIPNYGIYRSSDRGAAWVKVWPVPGSNLGPRGLRDIAFIPTQGPLVYATTFNGIFWSTDGGDTWNESIGGFGEGRLPREAQAYTAIAAPDAPDTIYAGTELGLFVGRFASGSLTWNVARSQLSGGETKAVVGTIYALVIDPEDSNRAFAAGKGDEIYRSEDGGLSWVVRTCEPCGSNVYALAYGQGRLYAAGGQKDGNPTLAVSHDGGDSWVPSNNGIPTGEVPTLVLSALAIDPANPEVIYAGTGFMVNDQSHGVFRSLDGGQSWAAINDGLPMAGGGKNYYVQGIAVDKAGGVYIAGFGGVHRLEGGIWTDRRTPK